MRFDWLLVKCASFFGQLKAGLRFARVLQEYEDTSDDDMNQAEAFQTGVTWEWKQETNMLDCDLCNAFLFSFFGMVHPLPTQPRSLST